MAENAKCRKNALPTTYGYMRIPHECEVRMGVKVLLSVSEGYSRG